MGRWNTCCMGKCRENAYCVGKTGKIQIFPPTCQLARLCCHLSENLQAALGHHYGEKRDINKQNSKNHAMHETGNQSINKRSHTWASLMQLQTFQLNPYQWPSNPKLLHRLGEQQPIANVILLVAHLRWTIDHPSSPPTSPSVCSIGRTVGGRNDSVWCINITPVGASTNALEYL